MNNEEFKEGLIKILGVEISLIQEKELDIYIEKSLAPIKSPLEENIHELESDIRDLENQVESLEYDLETATEEVEEKQHLPVFDISKQVDASKLEIIGQKGLENIPLDRLENFLDSI